ncbi:hypothetical protein [Streptomyces sp. NBC_00306]|uniref:hypothetical protein n=1 Tax=Streptomyces sp. NBC_00306 TaxID=2975708 RepID=UPI002E2C1B0C|nr:hypothetical protein [Streptomyces sp. NBC_00306]
MTHTPQQEQDRATLTAYGITEDDLTEALAPAMNRLALMARDQDRDPEEFFTSLPDAFFAALALGYLDARNAGHSGAALQRAAQTSTARALEREGRADLVPLATALSRYDQ